MRLVNVPNSFAKLAALKILWLKGHKKLPVEFGNLHAWEILDLRNCVRMEKLPHSFAKLATLKHV